MKKGLLLLIIGLFLLTGCGNKVKCTMKQEGISTISITGKFSGNKLKEYTYKSVMKFSNSTEYDTSCSIAKEMAKQSKGMKTTCKNRTVTTVQTLTNKENKTKKQFKETLKKAGYTCK